MNILIVEDSATIRFFLKATLNSSEFDIFEASNGNDAFQLFKQIQFDLVTMDIELEGMNGYETSKMIRAFEKENYISRKSITPIIFITSTDTIEGRVKGFEAGASDFIVKPFTKQDIISAIDKLKKSKTIFHGSTILIAEDMETSRMIISRSLKEQGATIIEAANGRLALDLLRHNVESVDMIITDLFMPEMNGDELCSIVRTNLGLVDLPIIFLTAAIENSYLLNIFKCGGNDYLTKPFVKEELVARVISHLSSYQFKKDLEKKILELKNLNKIKDDFLSICSHDLKSPIHGIMGFTELLLMDNKALNQSQVNYLESIKSSSSYLMDIINELLDLANIQYNASFEFIEIDLKAIIEESIASMQVLFDSKNINVLLESNNLNRMSIQGNKNAFKRIIINILSNSIKFTKDNGSIFIKLKSSDKEYEIIISDTGIGIPSDQYSKIMKRFSESRIGTKGEIGNGFGLSITKELIEKHGGKFSIESQENQGTKCNIILPAYKK